MYRARKQTLLVAQQTLRSEERWSDEELAAVRAKRRGETCLVPHYVDLRNVNDVARHPFFVAAHPLRPSSLPSQPAWA